MSRFSLASSGSAFCAFNTPRRDDDGRSSRKQMMHEKKKKKSILRSMMDRRRNNSSFNNGDFDEDESDNDDKDDKEDKDPDEIAFLSSRDGERYNTTTTTKNTNKEENKNISSIKLAATAPTLRDDDDDDEEDNDDAKEEEEEEEEPEEDKEETETLGIRERFGRLLTNTFRKKWDSKPAMLKGLRVEDVPRHVAIIMDGNARWAEKRRLPPRVGHENGVESLRAVVRCASAWGIKVVSVYTFSIENWSRGPPEVDGLLELLETTLREDAENLMRNDVKVAVMGDLSRVKPSLRRAVEETVEMTKENQGVVLNVALSYGGEARYRNAGRRIWRAVKFGSLRIEDISQETFMRYLGTANVLKEGEEDFFDDDRIDRKSGPLESDPLGDYAGVGGDSSSTADIIPPRPLPHHHHHPRNNNNNNNNKRKATRCRLFERLGRYRTQIYSFGPPANNACRNLCCSKWRTRNCISPTPCGRIRRSRVEKSYFRVREKRPNLVRERRKKIQTTTTSRLIRKEFNKDRRVGSVPTVV